MQAWLLVGPVFSAIVAFSVRLVMFQREVRGLRDTLAVLRRETNLLTSRITRVESELARVELVHDARIRDLARDPDVQPEPNQTSRALRGRAATLARALVTPGVGGAGGHGASWIDEYAKLYASMIEPAMNPDAKLRHEKRQGRTAFERVLEDPLEEVPEPPKDSRDATTVVEITEVRRGGGLMVMI
jgi:hypothetical protein